MADLDAIMAAPLASQRFNELYLSKFAGRCDYLDEADVGYEAARLDRYPFVFVFIFEGEVPTLYTAKGDAAEFARYFSGEVDDLDCGAVFAKSLSAAKALRDALLRRARPLRLVSSA